MQQLPDRHAGDFRLGPTQHRLPRRIGGLEIALRVQRPHQVRTHLPGRAPRLSPLDDLALELRVQLPQGGGGPVDFGGVVASDENPGHGAEVVAHRLVDEVDEAVVILARQPDRHPPGDVVLAGRVDLVQKFVEALSGQLREHLPHRSPDEVARPEDRDIGRVDVIVAVAGAREDGDEAGHLAEPLLLARPLQGVAAVGLHPVGGLDGGDEHAADAARRGGIRRRAVAQREAGVVPLLAMAPDPQQVIPGEHGLALAGENLVVEGFDLRPDLRPRFRGGQPERSRVLVPKDRTIAVVVDQDELRPPSQGHRKARRQHDVHGHAEARRPGRPRAEGRLRPVLGGDERRHLPHGSARELRRGFAGVAHTARCVLALLSSSIRIRRWAAKAIARELAAPIAARRASAGIPEASRRSRPRPGWSNPAGTCRSAARSTARSSIWRRRR